MCITLEPHGIFGSNFAYFNIHFYIVQPHGMQNNDEAKLPSINSVGQCLLMQMPITLEPKHFNIV